MKKTTKFVFASLLSLSAVVPAIAGPSSKLLELGRHSHMSQTHLRDAMSASAHADGMLGGAGHQSNSDDPALTGGGSLGFNENLRNYP